MEININNSLVEKAVSGNQSALNQLIDELQHVVFNLSMRFLYNREDAEDATQEILIKIITHLSSFQFKSKLTTWVYRIATNHLLNVKNSAYEKRKMGFKEHEDYINSGLNNISTNLPDSHIYVEEVRLSCSTGLLLCLTREQRIAFLFHSIFGVSSQDGAEIMGITSANFRKKVSLAKQKLQKHMSKNCGLFDDKNPCRCSSWVGRGIENGRLEKGKLNFVKKDEISRTTQDVGELIETVSMFKTHPEYEMKSIQIDILKRISGKLN